jgi:DNA-binding transcriptional MerR regulator
LPESEEEQPVDDTEGNLTIGAVSRALGVPAPTIRSWEWRYGLPTGRRRQGGQRRYTEEDVRALARMRDETAAGRGAAEVAALVAAAVAAPPPQVVDRLMAATHRLDTQGVHDALQRSRQTHGLVVTLEQVVLPVLQEVGRQWAEGSCDVAHEHLLAGAVQNWLAAQRAEPTERRGPVVLACGPQDQHTLALEALAVLLADQGFDCRYLGARTPVASLVLAAQRPPARSVVVVSSLDASRAAAVTALEAVAALPVPLFYAGAAFRTPDRREGVPGTYLGGSLSDAARQIAAGSMVLDDPEESPAVVVEPASN